MSDLHELRALLSMCASLVPLLLVYFTGMMLAVVRWQRHPTVSLLTLIAMVLLSVALLGGTFFAFSIPRMRLERAWDETQTMYYYTLVGFFRTGAHVVAGILLLIAIFSGRYLPVFIPPEERREGPEGPPDTRIRAGD